MKKFYAVPLVLVLSVFCLSAQAKFSLIDDDYAAGVSFAAFGGSVNNLSVDGSTARPRSPGTKSLRIVVPAEGYTDS